MSIASAAETLLKALGQAENAVRQGPALIALVTREVHNVEQTTAKGDDKLTAVLNQAEAFVSDAVPEAMHDLETIMEAVALFVNQLVALYNKAGAFIHGVEHALGKA